jgi:hypothetical protein
MYLTKILLLAVLVSPLFACGERIELDQPDLQYTEWQSETSEKEDSLNFGIKLKRMRLCGPEEPRSRVVIGFSDESGENKLYVSMACTLGEGIKYGYELWENGKAIEYKALFNGIPLNEELEGELSFVDSKVTFRALDKQKIIDTKIDSAFRVFGASSAKATITLY